MKTVCGKHVYAYDVGTLCPWCAPPNTKKSRLLPGAKASDVAQVFLTLRAGLWDAQLCTDTQGNSLLEIDKMFYRFEQLPYENIVEAFLDASQEYLTGIWATGCVELVQHKSEPRDPQEGTLYYTHTVEGYEVGITDHYRFFLSDNGSCACNALYVSYIHRGAGRSLFDAILRTCISDLSLGLTLK